MYRGRSDLGKKAKTVNYGHTYQDSTPFKVLSWPTSFENAQVCLFAIYSPQGTISTSTQQYLQVLADNGMSIIVCIAVESLETPFDAGTLSMASGILLRQNFGMDFAVWAKALSHDSNIWSAQSITFTNDSVFILPSLVENMLEQVRNSSADIVFLTESRQICRHGQSYFFSMKKNALRSASVRRFWGAMEPQSEKNAIIRLYETKILQLAEERWGCKVDILYPLDSLFQDNLSKDANFNVTHSYWLYLVWQGFPFVKVELLRDNPARAHIFGWQRVFEKYGADVAAAKAHLQVDRGNKSGLPAALRTTDGIAVNKVKDRKEGILLTLSELNRVRLNARRRRQARRADKN